MPQGDPLDDLRKAVSSARDGRALAREIQQRVEQLNTCLADAATLGLKVECQVSETFLNVMEDQSVRVPAWRLKCCIYQELGK